MSTIINTTVVSNFAAINQFHILQQLFTTLFLPTEVYEEINNGLEEGYHFYRGVSEAIYPINPNGWLKLTTFNDDTELRDLANLPSGLHSGESACLVIARHRKWLFLTDDRHARKVARQWQVQISGSLGCLVLAVEKGFYDLTMANNFLKQMIQFGYYSPFTDLTPLISKQV